ncbi:MAG: hypothetical protein ACKV0T_30250 [Planctomycetales bacterium]
MSEDDATEPVEIKLDGIVVVVPGTWKRVKPQTNIIDAEFELPRAEGDEFDGRLTLMAAGGDPQEVIGNRTAEFRLEEGQPPKIETLIVGEVTVQWVDLRGEWRGPTFRPVEPRPDYRMLLAIIPFTPRSAFYAKLTGPSATVAAHEADFRRFVESTKVTLPPRVLQ